jgi:arsenite methyltransferase
LKTNSGNELTCRMSDGREIYNYVRAVAGSAIRPGGMSLTGRAISFCMFGANPRLLDAGCGTGATVVFLRESFHFNAIALDISSSLIGTDTDKTGTFPFIRGDARQLPFCDAVMDGITCECVISVLENPDLAFAEFARVLRPGGYLILSDLYDRGRETVYGCDSTDGAECLKNIRPRTVTENMVSGAGFELIIWEDHTVHLKELAAQLILNGFSADELGESTGLTCSRIAMQSSSVFVRPGYYLLIARKT